MGRKPKNPDAPVSKRKHAYTKNEIEEYKKCHDDVVYFANNYMTIDNKDEGLIPLKLRPYQADLLKTISENRFSISMIGRQLGKTTVISTYILHYIIFNQDKTVGILANKEDIAVEIMRRLKTGYERLPPFLKPNALSYNVESIQLENRSRVYSFATSTSTVRGYSFNLLYIDECAHISSGIWDEFYTSVRPTLSSGTTTKMVITSTPKGMNHFYKLWNDSIKGRTSFVPFTIDWKSIPGRDEKWVEREIAELGSVEKFNQEHACKFIGSSQTLISGLTLEKLVYDNPLSQKDGVDIYEEPIKQHEYIMTVDPAQGKGLDSSAFIITDISSMPFKVVAKFSSNQMSELLFPSLIHKFAKGYNNAMVLVEVNTGSTIPYVLHNEYEYENLVWCRMAAKINRAVRQEIAGIGSFGNDSFIGMNMNRVSKQNGCKVLKDVVESNNLWLADYDIISELSTFVHTGVSYAAEDGYHDDLAMCLVMLGYFLDSTYYKEMKQHNIRISLHGKKMMEIDDGLLPFGFINVGYEIIGEKDDTQW